MFVPPFAKKEPIVLRTRSVLAKKKNFSLPIKEKRDRKRMKLLLVSSFLKK